MRLLSAHVALVISVVLLWWLGVSGGALAAGARGVTCVSVAVLVVAGAWLCACCRRTWRYLCQCCCCGGCGRMAVRLLQARLVLVVPVLLLWWLRARAGARAVGTRDLGVPVVGANAFCSVACEWPVHQCICAVCSARYNFAFNGPVLVCAAFGY